MQHGVVTIVTTREGQEFLVDDTISPFFLNHFDSAWGWRGEGGGRREGESPVITQTQRVINLPPQLLTVIRRGNPQCWVQGLRFQPPDLLWGLEWSLYLHKWGELSLPFSGVCRHKLLLLSAAAGC